MIQPAHSTGSRHIVYSIMNALNVCDCGTLKSKAKLCGCFKLLRKNSDLVYFFSFHCSTQQHFSLKFLQLYFFTFLNYIIHDSFCHLSTKLRNTLNALFTHTYLSLSHYTTVYTPHNLKKHQPTNFPFLYSTNFTSFSFLNFIQQPQPKFFLFPNKNTRTK